MRTRLLRPARSHQLSQRTHPKKRSSVQRVVRKKELMTTVFCQGNAWEPSTPQALIYAHLQSPPIALARQRLASRRTVPHSGSPQTATSRLHLVKDARNSGRSKLKAPWCFERHLWLSRPQLSLKTNSTVVLVVNTEIAALISN